MTLKSLGDGLRDLADAVETVDMRDRALAASGRLRTRRITTGVAGAVAVLLVGLLGFNSVWTDRAAPGGDPAAGMPSEVPMLPEPAARSGLAEDLSGEFFYLSPTLLDDGSGPESQSLLRWDGEGTVETLVENLPLSGTANVSPDGRYLSYVRSGQLMLHELSSGSEWAVMAVPDEQLCMPPVWAPDARRILVQTGVPGVGGPVGFYDITTGDFTQIGDVPGCHAKVWQDADGRDMLNYTTYDEAMQLTRLREVNAAESEAGYDWGILPGKWIQQPLSVSPDGDMMCVSTMADQVFPADYTDIRTDYCDTVAKFDFEGTGPTVQEIPFGSDPDEPGLDGTMVQQAIMFNDTFVARVFEGVDATELMLVDDDGETMESLPEPTWELDPVLIGYVP